MSKLFDTHAHYFAEKFNELEGGAEAILSSDEFKNTVGRVVCVGSDPINSRISVDLAKKYDFMYAAVGIHPEDAQNMCKKTPDEEIFDCVESLIADEKMRKENKIVAVGGTWLGKSSDIESGNWDAIRTAVKAAVELSKNC